MTSLMGNRVRLLGTLMLLMAVLVPVTPTAAQDDRVESVSGAVVELSRIERSGDLLLLHDRLHPDVRRVVSRAALGIWYDRPDAVIPTADPEILSVEFGSWTWPVTGRTYADVASVQVRQSGVQQGVEIEQVELQHYWFDGTRWRWFFGADAGFIDSLRAQVTRDASLGQFEDLDHARVDLVWSEIYAEAGVSYRSPDAVNIFSELDFPLQTGCGVMTEDDYTEAAYCQLDQEIYLMVEFQEIIERQFGDYAWQYAVSHEWGHHIQFLEGINESPNPELDDGIYNIEKELQADCLAGIYAQEAIARGWATEVDLQDAYQVAIFIGDLPNTPFDDPTAHGTGEQRLEAFTNGLEDGLFGCNLDLSAGI